MWLINLLPKQTVTQITLISEMLCKSGQDTAHIFILMLKFNKGMYLTRSKKMIHQLMMGWNL